MENQEDQPPAPEENQPEQVDETPLAEDQPNASALALVSPEGQPDQSVQADDSTPLQQDGGLQSDKTPSAPDQVNIVDVGPIQNDQSQATPDQKPSKAGKISNSVVPLEDIQVINEDDDLKKSMKMEAEKVKNATIMEKIEMGKKLKKFTKGATLASKDADSLEPFEVENDERHWSRHIQKVVMGIVALTLGIQIIYSNLSLIGTQKSQQSDFASNQELVYPVEQLYDLVELKFFANMTTSSVERQMECHEGKNKQVCLIIGREKCRALHVIPDKKLKKGQVSKRYYTEDKKYTECMQQVFDEQYGPDNLEFCRYAFGITTEVLKPEEYAGNVAEAERFACYDGAQKHVEYCYDTVDQQYIVDFGNGGRRLQEEEVEEGPEPPAVEEDQEIRILRYLKSCLQSPKMTSVTEEDIAKVDKEIECKLKPTADEELECLGKTINEYGKAEYLSVYYKKDKGGQGGYMAVIEKQDKVYMEDDQKRKQSIDQKFVEKIFSDTDFFHDLTKPDMYKKAKYRVYIDMIREFNDYKPSENNPNDTSECASKLAEYYNIPTTSESGIAKAAFTWRQAKDCFMKTGMPHENIMCAEMNNFAKKHDFQWYKAYDDESDNSKMIDDYWAQDIRRPVLQLPKTEAELISLCVTDAAWSVGTLYEDYGDQQRFIRSKHQNYLKWHEKKLRGSYLRLGESTDSKDEPSESKQDSAYEDSEDEFSSDGESESETSNYIMFKKWEEYCNRRFKVPEEITYCRVMTDTLPPESVDHCGQKHFSTPKSKYFEFSILFYYFCIMGEQFTRNRAIQTYEPDFKKQLDTCFRKMTEGDILPNAILCYREIDKRNGFENFFKEKRVLRNHYYDGPEEQYQYIYGFDEVSLYKPKEESTQAIEKFMCKNLDTTMQIKTKLKQPVHLKSPMGQTYVRPASQDPIGDFSFHFDEKKPYADFSNSQPGRVFADGTRPEKIYFTDWKYFEKDRQFEGKISFGRKGGHYKNADMVLYIFFDETFNYIEQSYIDMYKDTEEPFLENTGSLSFGAGVGLKMWEYQVVYDKRPVQFKYNCQALRQLEIENDIDDIIMFFYLEIDNRDDMYEVELDMDDELIQERKDTELKKIIANTPQQFTDVENQLGKTIKFVRKQNETFFKYTMSKELMFVDVKNYKMYKSYLNTTQQRFQNVHDLVAYQKKAFQNEIFETESKVVGHKAFEPMRIPIKISKRVEKAKIPDPKRTFLGIAVGFKDNITDIFNYASMGNPLKSVEYKGGVFKEEEEYEVYVGLDLDFTVQTFTYVYFTSLDIISALGGIGATIKIGLGAIVPILTLRYMIEFSNMQTRKARQKVRIFKLKDIMKKAKDIRKAINDRAAANKDDIIVATECKEALDSLDENSLNFRIAKKISKPPKTMAKVEDDLGTITYSKTKQVLNEWSAIRDKFLPDSDRWKLDDATAYDDPYELEERKEEREKYDHYLKRGNASFWTIIPLAQFRLSLVHIFGLSDSISFNSHKAKKLRNQLRIAIDQIKDDQLKIAEQQKTIAELSERVANLEK